MFKPSLYIMLRKDMLFAFRKAVFNTQANIKYLQANNDGLNVCVLQNFMC